ncbi:unnamed protein product [Umbelopsis vinacea]
MVSLKLLAFLAIPLIALANEAGNAHQQGGQFVLTPSAKFSHDKYNEKTANVKQFTGGDTLAYVTPWNNHGYDVVKQFKGKFDYVSPVWYYIEKGPSGNFLLNGAHDVDKGWMEEVRGVANGRKIGKIVPRFQFRGWTREALQAFVQDNKDASTLAQQVAAEAEKHGFDGIVLECGYPSFFGTFIKQLSVALHREARELLVVLPPVHDDVSKEIMTPEGFDVLAQLIDRFSLMSYDYSSSSYAGGPSAPIDWIEDNIEYLTNENNRHKLLVGLNMYAMVYEQGENPQAKVMNSVLDLIRDMRKEGLTVDLVWDKDAEEHSFVVSEDDGLTEGPTVWLPTPKVGNKDVKKRSLNASYLALEDVQDII